MFIRQKLFVISNVYLDRVNPLGVIGVVREALPSTLLGDELRQSNQIVGGGSEGEGPPDATATAELRLLLPGHRLDPAERLFDALADALTDGITSELFRRK